MQECRQPREGLQVRMRLGSAIWMRHALWQAATPPSLDQGHRELAGLPRQRAWKKRRSGRRPEHAAIPANSCAAAALAARSARRIRLRAASRPAQPSSPPPPPPPAPPGSRRPAPCSAASHAAQPSGRLPAPVLPPAKGAAPAHCPGPPPSSSVLRSPTSCSPESGRAAVCSASVPAEPLGAPASPLLVGAPRARRTRHGRRAAPSLTRHGPVQRPPQPQRAPQPGHGRVEAPAGGSHRGGSRCPQDSGSALMSFDDGVLALSTLTWGPTWGPIRVRVRVRVPAAAARASTRVSKCI